MRIYQSSLSYKSFEYISNVRPQTKINLLRSFNLADAETFNILRDFKSNIASTILDSGVWSKFNNPDIVHTVEDYALFLSQHASDFDHYFNYDEDFLEIEKDDFSSKNIENQQFLEKQGFKPVPVLHSLDQDEVMYYLEQKNKYQ